MTEPTSGPWRRWGFTIDGADGTWIAEADREPDARLIEKAPEMLALLRETPLTPEERMDWLTRTDKLIAYILGEPTREEEEERQDGRIPIGPDSFDEERP